MAQLQTLLQLRAVALPEVVEGCFCFIELTEEPEREGQVRGQVRAVSDAFKDTLFISVCVCVSLPLYSSQVLQLIVGHVVFRVRLQRLVDAVQQASPLRQRHLEVLL